MTRLKEQICRSIDGLDNHSLALLYEQIQILLKQRQDKEPLPPAPSIEEVLKLTSSSEDSWGDDVIADRGERL